MCECWLIIVWQMLLNVCRSWDLKERTTCCLAWSCGELKIYVRRSNYSACLYVYFPSLLETCEKSHSNALWWKTFAALEDLWIWWKRDVFEKNFSKAAENLHYKNNILGRLLKGITWRQEVSPGVMDICEQAQKATFKVMSTHFVASLLKCKRFPVS